MRLSKSVVRVVTCLFLAAGVVSAAQAQAYQDNFESYSLGTFPSSGGWTIRGNSYGSGPQDQFISNDRSFSGQKSFRMEGSAGLGVNLIKSVDATAAQWSFEAMINSTRSNSRNGGIGFTLAEGWAVVRFFPNGTIAAGVPGSALPGPPLASYAANTWVKLKVVFDNVARNYDVYVNDEKVGEDLPLFAVDHTFPINKAFLGVDNNLTSGGGTGLGGGTRVYFDDIEIITSDPNEAPVAVAGADQSIHAGQTVSLDGGASFDDNTPTSELLYSWTLVERPTGSAAVLSSASSSGTSFVADKAGTYIAALTVTDAAGLNSEPSQVQVSSLNQPPTSDAGEPQIVVVGRPAPLDGSASFDPDGDQLGFSWSIASSPAASVALIASPNSPNPYLTPDVAGEFEVQLEVSDAFGGTSTDQVAITAVSASDFAQQQIASAAAIVSALPSASVTTVGNQTAFINFLSQAANAASIGDFDLAAAKLNQAIDRTNGCESTGAPHGNGPGRDWITNCYAQHQILQYLRSAVLAISGP